MSESKPAFETTAGLVVVNPSGGRSRVTLDPLPFLIGRQAGNHLVLRDNRISRCHARIVADEGGFFVEDLNSRHGVYVNGAIIKEKTVSLGKKGDSLYALDLVRSGGKFTAK